MKWTICVLVLLWPFINTFAQPVSFQIPSSGLKIGEKIPDKAWELPLQVTNHPNGEKTIALKDFKGKLIILDFWSTWCGSCIAGMPKMETIQNSFKERIQVLPVTSESRAKVNRFREGNDKLKHLNLPSVVADTLLKELFPHTMVPHIVWIDRHGKVAATTRSGYVTAENVRKLLDEGSLTLPVKADVLDYDDSKPLLVGGNGGDDSIFLYRSLLTGYLQGIPTTIGTQINNQNETIRLRATNASVLNLFKLVYKELYSLPPNRIILEVSDSSQYFHSNNLYCYDLILPLKKRHIASRFVQQDLNRFFGINGRMEKRRIKCLQLLQSEPIGKPPVSNSSGKSISGLISWLNKIPGMPVIIHHIDDSRENEKKIIIGDSASSIQEIRRQLQSQGFDLREVEIELQMFVLSENPEHH